MSWKKFSRSFYEEVLAYCCQHSLQSIDKSIIVWKLDGEDIASTMGTQLGGKAERALRGHGHFVSDVVMSSDGQFALSGSWDKTLRLWDLTTLVFARFILMRFWNCKVHCTTHFSQLVPYFSLTQVVPFPPLPPDSKLTVNLQLRKESDGVWRDSESRIFEFNQRCAEAYHHWNEIMNNVRSMRGSSDFRFRFWNCVPQSFSKYGKIVQAHVCFLLEICHIQPRDTLYISASQFRIQPSSP